MATLHPEGGARPQLAAAWSGHRAGARARSFAGAGAVGTPLPTRRGHRGLQRRGQGLRGRGRHPWPNPPSVSGSSAPNKGPSPAGHRLEASCPRGYCHLRASRTESPAHSHSPGAQPPRGTCSGTCAPQAAPEWGTRRSPDGRRKAQETGAVSAATSSEDGGEDMGATRGGDAGRRRGDQRSRLRQPTKGKGD